MTSTVDTDRVAFVHENGMTPSQHSSSSSSTEEARWVQPHRPQRSDADSILVAVDNNNNNNSLDDSGATATSRADAASASEDSVFDFMVEEDEEEEEPEASSVVEGYSSHEEEEDDDNNDYAQEEEDESEDGNDDTDRTNEDDDDGGGGHPTVITSTRGSNGTNNNNEVDIELGLPLDDLDSDNDGGNSVTTENNSILNGTNDNTDGGTGNDETTTMTCRLRTWQWTRFFLQVVLFPVLVITSVAIPIVIVMFCFALMFVAVLVLLCVYYCCSHHRGDQAPVPFHVLIRQILEAVEDETGGVGDPSSDTPKYSREEIQNAVVRRKLVQFELTDPAGNIVQEDSLEATTDEATREDRMHQDMFPVIMPPPPPEVSASLTHSTNASMADDDDDDDSAHKGSPETGFRGIRKRFSSRRSRRKSSKKKVDEVDHNKTYELRLAPRKIMFKTDPVANQSKLFLLKRTYVFSPPLDPEKLKSAQEDDDDDDDGDDDTNNDVFVDVDREADGFARIYDVFGDDSSSSSSGFFPVIPSSSSSSSSSDFSSSVSSRASAQSSNESFLIDENHNTATTTTNNNNNNDRTTTGLHETGDNSSSHDSFHHDGTDNDDNDGAPQLSEGVPPVDARTHAPVGDDSDKEAVVMEVELEVDIDDVLDIETGLVEDPATTKMVEDASESDGSDHLCIEKCTVSLVPIVTDHDNAAARDYSVVAPTDGEKVMITTMDVMHGSDDIENQLSDTSIQDAQHAKASPATPTDMEETKTEVAPTATPAEDNGGGSFATAMPPTTDVESPLNDSAPPAASGELKSPSSQSLPGEPEHRGISCYCNICLLEYEVGDIVVWSRRPNGCHHAWHEDCLLDWLKRKPTCPNCRQEFFAIEDAPEQEASSPEENVDDSDEEAGHHIFPESMHSIPVESGHTVSRFW